MQRSIWLTTWYRMGREHSCSNVACFLILYLNEHWCFWNEYSCVLLLNFPVTLCAPCRLQTRSYITWHVTHCWYPTRTSVNMLACMKILCRVWPWEAKSLVTHQRFWLLYDAASAWSCALSSIFSRIDKKSAHSISNELEGCIFFHPLFDRFLLLQVFNCRPHMSCTLKISLPVEK